MSKWGGRLYIDLWDLESGNKKQILTGHKAEIKRILFIDNNIVKSYSVDGIVCTWNIEKCICIGNEKYQKKDLKKDRDYDIQLLKSGEVIIDSKTKLVGHEKEVIHYEYFPENNLFFSLSLDKVKVVFLILCLYPLALFRRPGVGRAHEAL